MQRNNFMMFLIIGSLAYFAGALYLSYFPQPISNIFLSPGEANIISFNLPIGLLIVSILALGIFIVYEITKEKNRKRKKFTKLFMGSLLLIGVISAMLSVPQLVDLWVNKNTAGIYPAPLGAYLITGFIWLGYAIAHRNKILIITYSVWILLQVFTLLGIFLFS